MWTTRKLSRAARRCGAASRPRSGASAACSSGARRPRPARSQRQEQQRDRAGRARQIPVGAGAGRRRHRRHDSQQLLDTRPPATSPSVLSEPSRSTSRAGRPVARSHSAPRRRWHSDAVAAMLASAQQAAATLTVRHRESAGAPVRGSMMWCIVDPSWLQRRTVVLEVARPPARDRDRLTRRLQARAMVVCHPHSQPPSGAVPRGRVPAELDEHAAAARTRRGLCRAIGGPRFGRGAEIKPTPVGDATRRAARSSATVAPADTRAVSDGPRAWARSPVAVPAISCQSRS